MNTNAESDLKFKNTAFIVGAGAHVPYGLPTSGKLTAEIKKLRLNGHPVSFLSNPNREDNEVQRDKIKICQIIRDLQLVERPAVQNAVNDYDILLGRTLDDFLDSFGRSQVYSIDSFLAKRSRSNPEDKISISIGKLLIAYFIRKHEESVPTGFHEMDWIQYLINEFLRAPRSLQIFFSNPPRFFTFNYDCILEKALIAHLTEYHGKEMNDAISMVQGLNIKHIYGQLPMLEKDLLSDSTKFYKKAIDSILVVGEERDIKALDDVSDDAYQALSKADVWYFLGFGFDELNTKLLFKRFDFADRTNLSHIKSYSTSYALTDRDRSKIKANVPVSIAFPPIDTCLELTLMREIVPVFEPRKNNRTKVRPSIPGGFWR